MTLTSPIHGDFSFLQIDDDDSSFLSIDDDFSFLLFLIDDNDSLFLHLMVLFFFQN